MTALRITRAASCSPRALELMAADPVAVESLAHGHLAAADEAVSLVAPGRPRSPIGLELGSGLLALCAPPPGTTGTVGGGELRIGDLSVLAGPRWDPRPEVRYLPFAHPLIDVDADELVGWGPGLTPLGDDVWCGIAAGGALLARLLATPAVAPAVPPVGATTTLSRSFMARAVLGELPEPCHALLEDGRTDPLLAWGATSGAGLLCGLAIAASRLAAPLGDHDVVARCDLELDLPASRRRVAISVQRVAVADVARRAGHR